MKTHADLMDAIVETMVERGLTRYAIARDLGMAQETVRRMFVEGANPGLRNLQKVCAHLGITFVRN